MNKSLVLTLFVLISTSLCAQTQNGIQIEDPWARCSKMKNGCVYMRIKSTAGDRLIKAEANDTAHQVEIHTHQVDSKGISHMLEIAALELPAGEEVVLKPLDNHIMLMKMKRELQVGQQVNMKLTFEKAGEIHVTVPVKERQTSCVSCKA